MSQTGKPAGYLPTLDGWRALSIIGVLFCHDSIHRFGIFSTSWLTAYGGMGVDIFFAISGILICSKLLREESKTGSINVTSFYIRRVARILPPAYAYLVVLLILARFNLIQMGFKEFAGSLLFLRNYSSLLHLKSEGLYTAHFWSLAIEEHFYLLLPAVLVFAKKQRIWVLSVICLLVAIRCGFELSHREWRFVLFHTDVRLNSILVPAMFVVAADKWNLLPVYKRWLKLWPVTFVVAVAFIVLCPVSVWSFQVSAVLLACMIYGSVLNPDNVFGRVLEWSPLRFIGRLSYSLYIWQQLFDVNHFTPNNHALGWLQSYPVWLVATFACALTSYYLIERPIINLGHKLSKKFEATRERSARVAI